MFLLFSASNFYSPRYLLCIMPFFILSVCYMLYFAFANTKLIMYSALIVIVFVGIFFSHLKKRVDDHNLTYMDGVKVSQEAIQYCEQKNLFESKIIANFLMRTYLTNYYCGYLKSKAFSNVSYEYSFETEYVIIENFEKDEKLESLINQNNFELVKKFESSVAGSAIYKRPH